MFPNGTVFVKTFELLTNQSDPTSLHRLETRLLVRDTNGAVYGVTYKWRPDNSDADLLYSNLTENIPIQTPTGVVTQMWYYPSLERLLAVPHMSSRELRARPQRASIERQPALLQRRDGQSTALAQRGRAFLSGHR